MTENSASTKASTAPPAPPKPDPASEVDDQTHRRKPEPTTAAAGPATDATSGTAGERSGAAAGASASDGAPAASPVKEGAVKAAAAALAAARSAAKKVQSAMPEGRENDDAASAQAGAAAADEPRPEMHYAAGSVHGTATPASVGAAPVGGLPEAGPRRVRLSISRVDPWSVMKLAFLLSVAIGFMIVVATMVVWYILNDMGTFATIQDFLQQTVGPQTVNIVQFIAFDRVVSMSVLIAIVDVVLLTAVATILAILYNITAALVGGVHLTLTDE